MSANGKKGLEQPMPISLSDLKTKCAALDEAPWSFDYPEPPAGAVNIRGAECRCDDTADPPAAVLCPRHEYVAEWVTLPNAAGVVAMRDAIDALIEIAWTTLAWQIALDKREDFGARAYRDDPFSITTIEHRAGAARLDRIVGERVAAIRAVFAKVGVVP